MSRIGDYIMAQSKPSDSFALFDKGRDSTARVLASEALANGNYNEAAQRIAHTGNLADTQTLSNTRDLSRDVYGGVNPVVGKAFAAQKAARTKAAQDAATAAQKADAAARDQTIFDQGQQDRAAFLATHGGQSPDLAAKNNVMEKAKLEIGKAKRSAKAAADFKAKYGQTFEEAELDLKKAELDQKKYAARNPTKKDAALSHYYDAQANKLEQEQRLLEDFNGGPGIPDNAPSPDGAAPQPPGAETTEISYDTLDPADKYVATKYGHTLTGRRVDPVTHAVQPDTDISFLDASLQEDFRSLSGADPLREEGLPASSASSSIMGAPEVQAAIKGGHDPYTGRELYVPGATRGQVFKTTQESVSLGDGNKYTVTVKHVRPFKGSGIDKEYAVLTPADFSPEGNLITTREKPLTDGQQAALAGKYGAALGKLNKQAATVLTDPKIMMMLDPNLTAEQLASDYGKAGIAVYAMARFANGAGVLSKTDVTMSDGSSFWSTIGGAIKDFKNEGKMTVEQAARVLKVIREGAELQRNAAAYNRQYIMSEARKNGLGNYSSLITASGGVIDRPGGGAAPTSGGEAPTKAFTFDTSNMEKWSDEELKAFAEEK